MTIISQDSWVIYGLRENVDGSKFRYIGLTTTALRRRLLSHIRRAKVETKSHPLSNWIQSVDFEVIAEVVEICPVGDLDNIYAREIYWIKFYRESQGYIHECDRPNRMMNIADGGSIGKGQPAWNSGMKMDDKYKSRLAGKNTGSYSRLGPKHSDESKARIGQASTSRWSDPDFISKHRESQRFSWSKGNTSDKHRKSMMSANHKRHHLDKDIVSKNCSFCMGVYPV